MTQKIIDTFYGPHGNGELWGEILNPSTIRLTIKLIPNNPGGEWFRTLSTYVGDPQNYSLKIDGVRKVALNHAYPVGTYGTYVNSMDVPITAVLNSSTTDAFRLGWSVSGGGGSFISYQYDNGVNLVLKDVINAAPSITLSTTDSRTLYENDTFGIIGSATDINQGNIVNVKYQINGETVRAISTAISSGAPISFSKILTFKQDKLYDGTTAVTSDLREGSQYVLKVWAEDDQGGKSPEQLRTFYVVPNRPVNLTINPISTTANLINTDALTISGTVSDPDANSVTVKYKIANGSYTQVYSGSGGAFTFNVLLSALSTGANPITIQATDSYGAITSKTLSVAKAENNQPLLTSVARYQIAPINGTAKGVLLWIQREAGDLVVSAEISMVATGATETFVPMTKESTTFVAEGIEEDEFTFDNVTAVEDIVVKLTLTRTSTASNAGITLISGVLS